MAKQYSGGIPIATSFKLLDNQPIVDYMVVQYLTDLTGLPNQFIGMESFVLENGTKWVRKTDGWYKLMTSDSAYALQDVLTAGTTAFLTGSTTANVNIGGVVSGQRVFSYSGTASGSSVYIAATPLNGLSFSASSAGTSNSVIISPTGSTFSKGMNLNNWYIDTNEPLYITPEGSLNITGRINITTRTSGGTDLYNNFIGNGAGESNISGDQNTVVGGFALWKNTTGRFNTAMGNGALRFNISGNSNIAIGNFALSNHLNPTQLTAIGASAMSNSTGGTVNTAVGYNALRNINGTRNTALGTGAGSNSNLADRNTMIGQNAMTTNTSGSNNTAIGYQAMARSTVASGNTTLGWNSGAQITTGNNNVILGMGSANASTLGITTGSFNTFLGANIIVSSTEATSDNQIILADGDGNRVLFKNSSGNVDIIGNQLTFNGQPLATVTGASQNLQQVLNNGSTAIITSGVQIAASGFTFGVVDVGSISLRPDQTYFGGSNGTINMTTGGTNIDSSGYGFRILGGAGGQITTDPVTGVRIQGNAGGVSIGGNNLGVSINGDGGPILLNGGSQIVGINAPSGVNISGGSQGIKINGQGGVVGLTGNTGIEILSTRTEEEDYSGTSKISMIGGMMGITTESLGVTATAGSLSLNAYGENSGVSLSSSFGNLTLGQNFSVGVAGNISFGNGGNINFTTGENFGVNVGTDITLGASGNLNLSSGNNGKTILSSTTNGFELLGGSYGSIYATSGNGLTINGVSSGVTINGQGGEVAINGGGSTGLVNIGATGLKVNNNILAGYIYSNYIGEFNGFNSTGNTNYINVKTNSDNKINLYSQSGITFNGGLVTIYPKTDIYGGVSIYSANSVYGSISYPFAPGTTGIPSLSGLSLVHKNYVDQAISAATSGSTTSVTWGAITGTLSAQTDLWTVLQGKQNNISGTGFAYWTGDTGYRFVTGGNNLIILADGSTATKTNVVLFQSLTSNFSASTNTPLSTTDTVIGAFNKIQAQINARIALGTDSEQQVTKLSFRADLPATADTNTAYFLEDNTIKYEGSVALSANGTTQISISHSLGVVPSFVSVQPKNMAAAGFIYHSADTTSIKVIYTSSPTGMLEYWVSYKN